MTIADVAEPEIEATGRLRRRTLDCLLQALGAPGVVCQLPHHAIHLCPPVWSVAVGLADPDTVIASSDDISLAVVAVTLGCRARTASSAQIQIVPHPHEGWDKPIERGTPLSPERGAAVGLGVPRIAGSVTTNRAGQPPHADASSALTHLVEASDVCLLVTEPEASVSRVIGLQGVRPGLENCIGVRSGRIPCGFETWIVDDSGQVVAIPRTCTVQAFHL